MHKPVMTTPPPNPTPKPSMLLEPIGGIAGDMLVAALLHLGAPLCAMRQALADLQVGEVTLSKKTVMRGPFEALRFVVELQNLPPHSHQHPHHHGPAHAHRHWKSIRAMLTQAPLNPGVKHRAIAVFTRLAQAEGSVHGITPEEVVFHEVGAWDSIADIVSVAVGLEALGIERVLFATPIPVGSGTIHSAHGLCPVPAPATLALLQGIEIESGPPAHERTTPTGAAVLAALGIPMPTPMRYTPLKTGLGAGSKNPSSVANVLRATLIQETLPPEQGLIYEHIASTQVNLDDASPEWLGWLMETLLQAGALDVGFIPLQMKKNRPAVRLEVLHHPSQTQAMHATLFRETTTLGVRTHTLNKVALPRQVHSVQTPYGGIVGKLAQFEGISRFSPEYDSCRKAAQTHGTPLRDVYQAAMLAFLTPKQNP